MRIFHIVLLTLCLFSTSSLANRLNLDRTIFEEVSAEENISATLLYSIALAESAFNPNGTQTVSPYPWVIRTPKQAFYEKSRQDAEKRLKELLLQHRSIDVGLMQLNIRWHAKEHSPEELLDPKINLRTAARFLNSLFCQSQNDLWLAVGRYHSRDPEKGKRYARVVFAIYSSLENLND